MHARFRHPRSDFMAWLSLCRYYEEQRQALEAEVFAWTPSLGLRWTSVERTECGREVRTVEVEGQAIRVKLRTRPGQPAPDLELDAFPEHEDVVRASETLGLPLRAVRARALAQLYRA